jgi:hypothetical protein
LFFGGDQAFCERHRIRLAALQEPDGDALGTARPHAWQALELADECFHGFWEIGAFHGGGRVDELDS